MIREIGEVTAINGQTVTITTALQQGCGGCKQQSHCGAGILSKALPNRRGSVEVWLENPPAIGSQVELWLPEKAILKFSVLLYLIPIITLLAGALIGEQLFPQQELYGILLAGAGFAASFFLLKQWLRRRDLQVRELMQINILPVDQP
ncbi:Fis family transcriptional regulator [Aliidiomarina iranensis]|uniref:Fis family transcriptional regulator n=1 Tax=Aliidiomarina iranensis TaxID=1434071 RepID=A0A432W0H3_9GAMM|nr:SoxR reducing system RseC family protein [Aliidiomarina iranensis]RUO22517.1 Fis family transcriptional regulator [Aliidiomarina iranensis]